MMTTKHAGLGTFTTAALCAVLTACSQGSTPGTAVSGAAVADGPVSGVVTLVDASSPTQERTSSTGKGGAFVFDTKGTQAPYLLKVSGRDSAGEVTLYGVSDGQQSLDVNPITDAAYAAAAGDKSSDQAFREERDDGRRTTSYGTVTLLNQLKTVLAPLFQRYGIVDPFKDTAQVKLLLTDVSFKVSDRKLTVTNKATGGVIYSASLRNLSGGTFNAANMPGGPCTTASEGASLYAASCQTCHGPLATSDVRGESLSDIREAISENEGGMGKLSGLTTTQLTAIAGALSGVATTCGGTACTYAYGEWTACVNGNQTRAVTSATPAGCTGTPVTSQTCTAPTVACTGYGYSAWGACVGGTQTRTVTSATPAGCTDRTTTPPVLSQSCTVGPTACTSYTYSEWSACSAAGQQTRTVLASMPSGCTDLTTSPPVLSQSCAPAPACTGFTYSAWGTCSAAGQQTRTVSGYTPASCTGTPTATPVLTQSCTPAPVACTSYTYNAWGTCSAAGQQTRTVATASPSGCTDRTTTPPVLTQSCTAPIACTGFVYSAWGTCSAAGQQTRTVTSYTPASCTGTPTATPVLTQSCTPAPVACTSYTYTAWGTCSAAGMQTRAVATASPSGCTNQTTTPPVLTQSCTPTPTCTLATAVPTCSSCHGGATSNNSAPSNHGSRSPMCATCHTGISATATAGTAGACVLNYPQGGTHSDGSTTF